MQYKPWLLRSALLIFLGNSAVSAQTPQSATVQRILDGPEVFINERQARQGQTANRGSRLRTGNSRAELLFDRRAYGRLGRQTQLVLDNRCFRLVNGAILISGSEAACVNSRILAVRGTTYHLQNQEDGSILLSVLTGTVEVSPLINNPEKEQQYLANLQQPETNALDLEPRVPVTLGIGSQATFNQVSTIINGFVPLAQTPGRNLFFSQLQAGTTFGPVSGGSALLGYRYQRENGRIDTFYGAYDGFSTAVCGRSNIGIGYETLGRDFDWRVNGYIPADGCPNRIGGFDTTLAIPFAQLGSAQDLRLNLTPYYLSGQIPDTWGGRLEISLIGNPNLEARAGVQYDEFFGTALTFRLIGRLPLQSSSDSSPLQRDLPIATDFQEQLIASQDPSLLSQADNFPLLISAGQTLVIFPDGTTGSIGTMDSDQYSELVITNAQGYDFLPDASGIFQSYSRLFGDSYSNDFYDAIGGQWTTRSPELIPRLDATSLPQFTPLPEPVSEPVPDLLVEPMPEPMRGPIQTPPPTDPGVVNNVQI